MGKSISGSGKLNLNKYRQLYVVFASIELTKHDNIKYRHDTTKVNKYSITVQSDYDHADFHITVLILSLRI